MLRNYISFDCDRNYVDGHLVTVIFEPDILEFLKLHSKLFHFVDDFIDLFLHLLLQVVFLLL